MTETTAAVVSETIAGPRAPSTVELRDRVRGHKAFLAGLAIIGLLAIVSILAPVLAPHDPTAIHASDGLNPSSSIYLLGTDNLGRDILSRIIFAARTSLFVALGSVLVAGAIGVPLGLIAGYAGGKIDSVIMRVLDAILAFPVILLAILVVATLGTQTLNLILTIGFVFIPYFTRLVRGNVLTLKEQEFVAASRASGADNGYLVTRVILPNILSPIIVETSLSLAFAILAEASLSFFGLGTQPPDASWGRMLSEGRNYFRQSPWMGIFPGLAIMFVVMGFNFLGDGLRDALDPRLKR